MLTKTVRIRIDKHTRLRYVIIPNTGEVWIWVVQRLRFMKWKGVLHQLKPGDQNLVNYEFVEVSEHRMWEVVQRATEMSNERAA